MKQIYIQFFLIPVVYVAAVTGALALGPTPISTAGLNPNPRAVANSINSGITPGVPPFFFTTASPQVTALLSAVHASQDPNAALNQLSPEAFGRFTTMTAFNNASFETQAMDTYLASRRDAGHGTFFGGNGQLNTSGLTINDPSYDPNLAMIHSQMLAWNPAPFSGLLSDASVPVLGGIDMKDSKDMKSMSGEEYSDPWNVFVRGSVVLAQGFSQQDVAHFDANTAGITVGTDYRLTPNLLVGLTAAYGHTDATLDPARSSATVDSYSPGLYVSYADQSWYANVTGSYVHNAYTQSRNIPILGSTANSAPEGNEGVANVDGGYDFHAGALTYGPLAGVQYTHLTVDGYSESGAPFANLTVNEQQSDSLRSRLGGRVSYAFSHHGMTFTPHLEATWQHEFMDQSRAITSQFVGAGIGSFNVSTPHPSRDFALATAGGTLDINRTVSVFTDYSVQAGQDNYFGQSVQAGVKIGF